MLRKIDNTSVAGAVLHCIDIAGQVQCVRLSALRKGGSVASGPSPDAASAAGNVAGNLGDDPPAEVTAFAGGRGLGRGLQRVGEAG